MRRQEAAGASVGFACFAATYALLYEASLSTNPVNSSFLTDIAVALPAIGFGCFYFGFKDLILRWLKPKPKHVLESYNPSLEEKTVKGEAGIEAKVTRAQVLRAAKIEAIVRAAVAGFGGGAALIYAGLKLLPIIPEATLPGWALVPVSCLGGGIALVVIGFYSIVMRLRR